MEWFRVESAKVGCRGLGAERIVNDEDPLASGSIGFRPLPAKESSTLRYRVLTTVGAHRNSAPGHELDSSIEPGGREGEINSTFQLVDEVLGNAAGAEMRAGKRAGESGAAVGGSTRAGRGKYCIFESLTEDEGGNAGREYVERLIPGIGLRHDLWQVFRGCEGFV